VDDISQRNIDFLRNFVAPFIDGKNVKAILGTLGDEDLKMERLTISVNDQLSLSTASAQYLDKLAASRGLPIRPAELGMEDLAFRQMGIEIDANKQITEVLHTVLATFYGDEAVRAYAQSGTGEPYQLADGMELLFMLEDGIEQILTFQASDFTNISQASAREVSDVITRYLRNNGYGGFGSPFVDVETGETLVRIFGAAKGPYGQVIVTGGEAQTVLRFPFVRGTELALNDTVWEITRNIGSTLRFRWAGTGSAPALDKVLVGDRVLLYGSQFKGAGLGGTYVVTDVRPPQPIATYDSGWFEFEKVDFSGLKSSLPDVAPPANQAATTWSIGTTYPIGYIVSHSGKFYESLQSGNVGNQPDTSPLFWAETESNGVFYTTTLTQNEYQDLMFVSGKKNTPYSQPRFALAWEPDSDLLRIYMPATTKVVKRDLIGSAHIHALYPEGNLDGAFGSATDPALQVEVITEYSIRYPQNGFDNQGTGGTLQHGVTTVDVDYAAREAGYVTLVTTEPHGITGSPDSFGRILSTTLITVAIDRYNFDDVDNPFLGAYMVDPAAGYALSPNVATSREQILAGESRNTLFVKGLLPNQTGYLWFDLNRDTEEGPVRYFGAQVAAAPTITNLVSISQNGTTVTVITAMPHGAVPGSSVLVAGTSGFNGTYTVAGVPSPTVYTFQKTPPAVTAETGVGTSSTLVDGVASTLLMDPSYNFRNSHAIGADVTLLEQNQAYQPLANGLDYGFYVTGTADGRVFAEALMRDITAAGIKHLDIVIVYPNDVGLGNQGLPKDPDESPHSEAVEVWGQ
jgi:hypothetical protein